jgi:hypothetical protein
VPAARCIRRARRRCRAHRTQLRWRHRLPAFTPTNLRRRERRRRRRAVVS